MPHAAQNPATGRYQLYKQGTARIVAWLVETASKIADTPKSLCSLNTLDGAPNSTQRKQKSVTIVKTRELLAFARVIATASLSRVPPAIIDLIAQVIEGRQACADWYALEPASTEVRNRTSRMRTSSRSCVKYMICLSF